MYEEQTRVKVPGSASGSPYKINESGVRLLELISHDPVSF